MWSCSLHFPPLNLGPLGGGQLRVCQGHRKALGAGAGPKAAAPALHREPPQGWHQDENFGPRGQLAKHPHPQPWDSAIPHPAFCKTCLFPDLGKAEARPLHGPIARAGPGSDPSCLPLQRPTHAREQLLEGGGILLPPCICPVGSHRLGRGGGEGQPSTPREAAQ